uniref:Uncharacterized protein n=1 Tax=Anguilla anguilla TaxID=7936 RepID=A0A0E9X6K3_ANGAN
MQPEKKLHSPICMSAKLKKLSTSLPEVFLLSETKTFVPLNTSSAMLRHASTTPSPFNSKATTGPLVISSVKSSALPWNTRLASSGLIETSLVWIRTNPFPMASSMSLRALAVV